MIVDVRRRPDPGPRLVRAGDLPPGTVFLFGETYYLTLAHNTYGEVTIGSARCEVPVAELPGWKVNGLSADLAVPEHDVVPNATLTGDHG